MPPLRFSIPLSILDQCPIPEGSTAGDALRNTIDLARRADQLGYFRYWLAEHHGTPGLACNSPEVMIGPVAQATQNLRVGSGGIMLPHYSPLKVAETFSMLAGLFPDRIDLGLGRAPGTSARVAFALQRDRRQPALDDFPEQLDELLDYLYNRRHANQTLVPGPFRHLPETRFHTPEVSLLGSSEQSAIWAAELGLPYVFADFINPNGSPYAAYYRDHFQRSPQLERPHVAVCVWALCAETSEEALRLSSSARMMLLSLFRGRLLPVPPVDKALAYLAQEGIPIEKLPEARRIITGDPTSVRAAIESVAHEYEADEVFIVNILHDPAARIRCYELIAESFR